MRKALVTGACGLLGQHLVNRLKSGYRVAAVDIAENVFLSDMEYINADLTNPDITSEILSEFKPDIIFNCASYTDVDRCESEREKAYALNVGLVENLLEAGAGRLVHYSTDYVFSGENGPYAETDETNPVGYYGETKLFSENRIEDSGGDHLVIRTNVLFGMGLKVRPNFITWLIEKLRRGEQVSIVTDQFNNPISAANLAEASVEAGEKNITGILHIAGNDYLSRYDIAVKTAEVFDLDISLIAPISTAQLGQVAKRPLKGGLKIDKAGKMLETRLLGLVEALNGLRSA